MSTVFEASWKKAEVEIKRLREQNAELVAALDRWDDEIERLRSLNAELVAIVQQWFDEGLFDAYRAATALAKVKEGK